MNCSDYTIPNFISNHVITKNGRTADLDYKITEDFEIFRLISDFSEDFEISVQISKDFNQKHTRFQIVSTWIMECLYITDTSIFQIRSGAWSLPLFTQMRNFCYKQQSSVHLVTIIYIISVIIASFYILYASTVALAIWLLKKPSKWNRIIQSFKCYFLFSRKFKQI